MKRKIVAILLLVCLLTGMLPSAFAAGTTLETSVNMDQLVSHGISLFKAMEAGGKWDSVTNTSTCVGMGILGWINSAALQLLKWCASGAKGGNPELCKAYLGEELYNEVVSAPVAIASELMPKWGYWGSRRFSSTELAAAKALLGSELGIRVQKNLARLYITKQANRGWDAGVRTEAGLLYYCSADNHYGVKGFMTKVKSALGLSSSGIISSLRQFHQGAVLANVETLAYRTKVYNYLVNTLKLDQDGDEPIPTPAPTPDPTPTVPFTDMPSPDSWAYDPIVWAYTSRPQITNGTTATTFSPNKTVTRAEAMTFLWTMAGKPEPTLTESPFTDVQPGKYYYKPVLWAYENHITGGKTDTSFAPKDKCSRAEVMTFLWTAAGKQEPSTTESPFEDVQPGKYYYKPILWAAENNVTGGTGEGEFSPKAFCSRAQVVTFLYKVKDLLQPVG